MKTSIVIASFNKLEYTQKCIESIRQHTLQETYEIIVVDNGSTDDSQAWLSLQQDIKLIPNASNLGFPKACNQGMEIAEGDSILLLNNDTVVTENWLTNMCTALFSDDTVGAVGTVTNSISYYQAIKVDYTNLEEMQNFARSFNVSNPLQWEERLKLVGYCMLIKKSVVEEIGLLDEQFSPGNYEDDDYSLRIRWAGYKLLLCKDTFIHHFGSVTWRDSYSINYGKLLSQNHQKFIDKWGLNPHVSLDIKLNLFQFIRTLPGQSANLIEIGCGCGANLIMIRQFFPNINTYGIEINQNAASIALLDTEIIKVEQLQENYYDYIILSDLFSQHRSPRLLLNEVRRSLKDNGSLLICVDNLINFHVIKGILDGMPDRSKLNGSTFVEIEKLLQETGFHIAEQSAITNGLGVNEKIVEALYTLGGMPERSIYEVDKLIVRATKHDTKILILDSISALFQEVSVKENFEELNSFAIEEIIEVAENNGIAPVEVLNRAAISNFQAGLYDFVLPYLHKAYEIRNDDVDTIYNLSYILHRFSEDRLALNWVKSLIRKDEETVSLQQSIEEAIINQIAATQTGKWVEKISHCLEESDSLVQLEILKELVVNFDEVLHSIDAYIWEQSFLLNRLATLCYENGLHDFVLPFLQQSLQYDGQNPLTLLNLASVLEAFGEPKLALTYLERIENKDDDILSFIKELKSKVGYTVSIIIPVFNKAEYTKQCLEAIVQNTPEDIYEVVIVDNASTDGTVELLDSLEGDVKIISNTENLGFVGACNLGAEVASGRYLLFLNNDTAPTQGWLESLVELAERDPDTGIVGAMLIYPNGLLQEAGGIIWSDATGWNYGRGKSPLDPAFQFVREVDYCSGACLLISKDLFYQVGGFDSRYSPGYYEDTDLCFAVRELGYKVMYQPLSKVIHYEGVSSGTNLTVGMKKYQVINQQKFFDKWSFALKKQFPYNLGNVILASSRGKRKNILIIDPTLPMHDRASGSQRLFNIIKIMLIQGHHITYIARDGINQDQYKDQLQAMGVEVLATDVKKMKQMGYNISGAEFDLPKLMAERFYDIAWLSFYYIAEQYLPEIRLSPSTHVIIDTVDVHYLREIRMAEISNDQNLVEQAILTKHRECSIYSLGDTVITVTNNDAEVLRKENPHLYIEVLPNIHQLIDVSPSFIGRDNIIFVGNFGHPPNKDAVEFFISSIWPKVKEAIAHIKLYIVGNGSKEVLTEIKDPNIIIEGYVPSVEPYLNSCRISIAPLRFGAGMKGKVGEALSFGLPVVTTSIGSEGMGLMNGTHALIRDSADDFAQAIIELYEQEELWTHLSNEGKKFMKENYSFETVRVKVQNLIQTITKSE